MSVTTGDKTDDETCAATTYDLTTPPTRADLDMPDGKAVVDTSCDDGFEAALKLPDGVSTSLTARRVNADSYAAGEPTIADPTTMDVHSTALDLDAAGALADRVAHDLGIDATALRRWRSTVPRGADNVQSPFVRATLGYLTAELQLQYLGASGTTYVHLVLSWTPAASPQSSAG